MFTFINNTKLFSKVLVLIYTHPPPQWESEFTKSHQLGMICLFIFCHGVRCKMVSHYGYDLCFLDVSMWLNTFSDTYFPNGVSVKFVFKSFTQFLVRLSALLIYSFLYILVTSPKPSADACFFTHFMVSFNKQILNFNNIQFISNFLYE